ncbi:MAG: RNA pseudouridine synthase, partial [Desulfobacterales bacterium]|nr:RNA pseudouridine synthase [Desulfobacterales bacterium]
MKTTENPFSVVGRGNGWICIDKPGGVSVHNDPGRDVVSLLGNVQPVHRLDRETSGLLLLALDKDTTARLSRLFAGGKVEKRYKALVHGNFDVAGGEGGIWDRALTKQAGGRKDPAGRGKKLKAVTRFRIEDISPHYTLLDITLET